MRRWMISGFALLALGLADTGCGGDDDSGSSQGGSGGTGGTAATGGGGTGGTAGTGAVGATGGTGATGGVGGAPGGGGAAGSDGGTCTPGQPLWNVNAGDSAQQGGAMVKVDGAGNAVVAGRFAGSMDFGGGTLTAPGPNPDCFLARFTPTGSHVWSKSAGTSECAPGWHWIGVAGSGTTSVALSYQGTADLGQGAMPSAGGNDVALAQIDPSGTTTWSQRVGDASEQLGFVAANAAGNVAVAGHFNGAFGTLTNSTGAFELYAGKLDTTASTGWAWLEDFTGAGSEVVTSVEIDGQGATYLSGGFTDGLSFGGTGSTPLTGAGAYLAKLDASGAAQWSVAFGTTSPSYAQLAHLAADGSGNLFGAGFVTGSASLPGGGQLTSSGGEDLLLVKLDGAGSVLWTRVLGDAGDERPLSLSVDAAGNALLSVSGIGNFTHGTETIAVADEDVLILRFDPAGQALGNVHFPASSAQGARVALDGQGNLLLAGTFTGSFDLGLGAMVAPGGAGDTNVFVAKLCGW